MATADASWPRRRSLFQSVSDFWIRPIRPEPLALFRITLSATIFVSLLTSLVPSFQLYLSPEGICPANAMDEWMERTGRFTLLRGPKNIPILEQVLPDHLSRAWVTWGESTQAAAVLLGVWLVALAGLMVGFRTRLCCFVAWLLAVTFHTRLSWVLNGGDAVSRAGLFYLMLAPAGAAFSLDARRAQAGTELPILVPPWSVRLMQIQLGLIYFFTGLAKLGSDWFSGEAVYWVLNDISLTRWPYYVLPVPLVICKLLSWTTLAWEISFPFLLLVPRLRLLALLIGVGFHLGIWATVEVGWFSQVMLCWYTLFLPAERLDRVCRLVCGGKAERTAPG